MGETHQIIWFDGESGDGDPIESSKILNNPNDFIGSYHFGTSEGESTISFSKGTVFYELVRQAAQWSELSGNWIEKNTDLKGIQVKNGLFEQGEWKGQFVYYYYQPVHQKYKEGKIVNIIDPIIKLKGLIIYNSPVGIANELGIMNSTYQNYTVAGQYPESHYRLLNREDLTGRSKHELRMMRNEIYARYGYIFTPGGEMDRYFQNQVWYRPRFRQVDKYMNEVEKRNIDFILSHE